MWLLFVKSSFRPPPVQVNVILCVLFARDCLANQLNQSLKLEELLQNFGCRGVFNMHMPLTHWTYLFSDLSLRFFYLSHFSLFFSFS